MNWQPLKVILTVAERELIRYFRDRARVVSTLFQPLMFLFVFGSGLQGTLARGGFGVDFLKFMYPGIVAMSIMGVAFFSTISTVWDREFGFLKEILVAPVSRVCIALGKTAGAAAIAAIQGLLLLGLAPFLGVTFGVKTALLLMFFMLLLALTISGLGLLIASVVRTIENFSVIMNFLVFPMFFLSGAFFPLTNVPGWLKVLSAIDPLAYGVDAMRQVMLAPQVPVAALRNLVLHPVAVDLGILLALGAAFLTAAVVAFERRN